MTSSNVVMRAVTLLVLVIALVASTARVARADNVDDLAKQLDDSSAKVRLAATINLTKTKDPRAILPLAKHVNEDNEDDENVRAAAAAGLGQLIDSTTKGSMKRLAVSALQKAQTSDSKASVKKQADKALTTINGASATPAAGAGGGQAGLASTSASGGIYINVGPMSSKTGTNDPARKAMMFKWAAKTVTKKAPHAITAWPGGGTPTNAQLTAKSMMGFYVDGTLNTVTVTKSGKDATVACKVSMLLADFPNKNMFGFLNGGAQVTGSSSDKDIELSIEDCVSAVVESLVESKVVPTIKTKCGCTP